MPQLTAKQQARKDQLLQRKQELLAKAELIDNKIKNIDEEITAYTAIETDQQTEAK